MKNIAVLVHDFAVEYADLILSGIYKFFAERKDVRVFFVQTWLPHEQRGLFDYQYWSSIEYLKSDSIDEIIIVSNTYSYACSLENIRDLFECFFNKKVISVGFDLNPEKTHFIYAGCSKSYEEVVSHLKNEHNCKNIAFYSANKLDSPEAHARYAAFKNALKKNKLEFHKDWVFAGNFTPYGIEETLSEKYKCRADVPFDAMICANDIMGMAVINYFISIGLKVPEELKIIGLDNTYHSVLCTPSLSTIDQDIEGLGYRTAKFGLELFKDKEHPHCIVTEMKPVYRHSCGCSDQVEQKKRDIFKAVYNRYSEFRRLKDIFDLIQGASSIQTFADSLKSIVKYTGFTNLVVFVLPEPLFIERNDEIELPGEARILLEVDTESGVSEYYENSEYFDYRKSLFIKQKINKNPGCFVFQPLFQKDEHYGYLICRVEHTDFTLNSLLLKVITSVIVQNYSYTKTIDQKQQLENVNKELKQKATELHVRSQSDELTGILNRRGFMEYGRRFISLATDMDTTGLVFFADLDGLKTINDTYGHDYGDRAIKAESEVLRLAFRKMDIIGRLSGDEFGIVATGMDFDFIDKLREKVDKLNEEISRENNFPFTLSISLGAVKFDENNCDLEELLKIADKNLYEQKKIHHARNKQ